MTDEQQPAAFQSLLQRSPTRVETSKKSNEIKKVKNFEPTVKSKSPTLDYLFYFPAFRPPS
jgi:hypothetical protein